MSQQITSTHLCLCCGLLQLLIEGMLPFFLVQQLSLFEVMAGGSMCPLVEN